MAPRPADILEKLDAAAAGRLRTGTGAWPTFDSNIGAFEYHAMRIAAARARHGPAWGIVIERVQGDCEDGKWPATVETFMYGSEVRSGSADTRPLGFYVDEHDRLDGLECAGPAGPMRFRRKMIRALDLRPRRWSGDHPGPADPDFVLLLRAYLSLHPDAFFLSHVEVLHFVGLEAGAPIIAMTDRFEHVVGSKRARGVRPSPWHRAPSESTAYRTLADAIAARDPSRFEAGQPTTDWRVHARFGPP